MAMTDDKVEMKYFFLFAAL